MHDSLPTEKEFELLEKLDLASREINKAISQLVPKHSRHFIAWFLREHAQFVENGNRSPILVNYLAARAMKRIESESDVKTRDALTEELRRRIGANSIHALEERVSKHRRSPRGYGGDAAPDEPIDLLLRMLEELNTLDRLGVIGEPSGAAAETQPSTLGDG